MIEIGPLVLAADRLIGILLVWLFLTGAGFIGRRFGKDLGQLAWSAVLIGVVAARLAFVAQNQSAYLAEPWAILAVWQGGFTPWAGVLVAAGVVLIAGRGQRASVILAASACLLFAVYQAASLTLETREKSPFPLDVQFETLERTPLQLETLGGRPFVVNLWASWCGPCRREMPMLVEVAETSATPILLINQGEDAAVIRNFLEREGIVSGMILLDPDQALSAAVGSRALPATLFVDTDGMIQKIHIGEISRAALMNGIREIETSAQ